MEAWRTSQDPEVGSAGLMTQTKIVEVKYCP